MDSRFDWRSPSSRLVLTAVLDILATRGYEGLTLAEVANRAGPAGPALSSTLDVDDLVMTALGQVQLLAAPRPTGSLRGDLLALLSPWRTPRRRDEMVIAAVLSAAEWRPSLKAAVSRALDRPIAQAVGEVLARALAEDESASWAQTLNWILRGLVLERLRTGARSPVDLEGLVDFLLAGVDRRRAAEKGSWAADAPTLRSDGRPPAAPMGDVGEPGAHPHHGATGKVASLQLIPGHVATEAEIWLWTGVVPEASDRPGPWVVVRTDDWPMSPATARELAGALLRAANRAEAPVLPSPSHTGEIAGAER